MQTSKYLLATERDAEWGLTISTVGREEIAPGEEYPTKGHADGYYFDIQKGRTLDEYQLLYQPEGEGVFHSAHFRKQRLRLETSSCSFPVNGTPTIHQAPRDGKAIGSDSKERISTTV